MDYIYGIISQKAKAVEYSGAETETATTTLSGNIISVGVKNPIPTINAVTDIGKSLVVNDAGKSEWGRILPAYNSVEDVGKVLKIGPNGTLIWA